MKTKNGMINFYSIMCGLWIDLQSTVSNIIRIRIKMIRINLNSSTQKFVVWNITSNEYFSRFFLLDSC